MYIYSASIKKNSFKTEKYFTMIKESYIMYMYMYM